VPALLIRSSNTRVLSAGLSCPRAARSQTRPR
jgi:hypothetical protein